MAEVNIGEFRRPGIFVKEFDNSAIDTPTAPQGLQTLVVGFSKKGVFNAPVTLNTQSDLEAIYGPIDRNLEKKGSFFHRTISKMLETAPVVALNLLLTDDTLDTVEYKSMSTSSGSINDVKRNGAYRRFFDVSGFWSKDTESFLSLVSDNPGNDERPLHFVNLSDKPITYFIFKSARQGFDVTLLDWYGANEKVPTYLHPQDYVSDYMVDIYVVAGDWTNYQDLAVDARWDNYFGVSGLRKDQVLNFVNDQNVTTLKTYEGLSLIPYFRDQNGNNIFIENIVNRDTNLTGLFCSFDIDAVETDYRNGLIDIIGNNLANDATIEEIDFLSYKDTIVEKVSFTNTPLDLPGNVLALNGGSGINYRDVSLDRGATNGEGYIYGVSLTFDENAPVPTDVDFMITYSILPGAYIIVGGLKHMLNETEIATTHSFTITAADYNALNGGSAIAYHSLFVIDSNGEFKQYDNKINSDHIVINGNDIVLAYVDFNVENQSNTKYVTDIDLTNISVDENGYVELAEFNNPYLGNSDFQDYYTNVPQSRYDYSIIVNTAGSVTFEFEDTAGTPDTSEYEQWRRIRAFNNFLNYLDGPNALKMAVMIDNEVKKSFASMSVSDIQASNDSNKSFTIVTGADVSDITDMLNGNLIVYIEDDEFVLGLNGLVTKDEVATTDEGVVAKYSNLYEKFRDGIINTGDFFYENNEEFVDGISADVTYMDVDGVDYIVFQSDTLTELEFISNDKILLPQARLNTEEVTIINGINVSVDLGLTGSGYWSFEIAENTTAETITDVDTVWMTNQRHYLKMYFDSSNNLSVQFSDQSLSSDFPLFEISSNQTITVFSQKNNFKQTVEIESPTGWVTNPNKILVKGDRFSEIKAGDFLLAWVDEDNLEIGEVPRRLTRIVKKVAWPTDPTYTELSCDARIDVENFDGDLQTTAFTTVEDYINFYNGISMKGFKVRKASQPDGTDDRMNDIMNLIEGKQSYGVNWVGTNLFNALTNKEAISFRYIVDSFGLGLTANSKQQLMQVSGKRLDCFSFLNMPSMKAFKKSSSPSFVDEDGALVVEYISQGGNPESNPAFLYGFGEGVGVSTVGFFAPYVTVNDNGRPLSFPPSSHVATTYLRKHNSVQTTIKPWTVAAGITNGRVTNIGGLEYNFTPEDVEFMNNMKANPIVSKRNRGFVIETENTAQKLVTSALSFIHVREVLIQLEGDLAAMLLNFHWSFNTPEIRGEIKYRADVICEKYVNQNGLFNFFNKIDEENNTPDLIDNQIGVLDTYVEPIKAMGVIVNNITILRTGGIASAGFNS